MDRRVVITGLGLVTPLGTGVKKTWDALCAGESGVAEITRFDTSQFDVKIGAEVKDFNPIDFLPKKDVSRTEMFIAYAVAAAQMAVDDSGFQIDGTNAHRIGTITGCGLGGLSLIEDSKLILEKRGPKRVSPFLIPMIIGNMSSGTVAIRFGIKGPTMTVATACAAGTHAIGESYKMIKSGVADAMISGGAEAVISPLAVSGFSSMKALSKRECAPHEASCPFDKDRDGFIIGEGSGIVFLETLDSALNRGATIYAEVIGYGLNGEGFHMTAPAPEGAGMAACMTLALESAGISYKDVDYINAHGTSTPLNDMYETQAIKSVFKDHASSLLVSSTKSMTGHLLGAAGGVETVFTALTIHNGIVLPTINLKNADEGMDLDYIPNVSRQADVKIAMSNSFGFGGTNASLLLSG